MDMLAPVLRADFRMAETFRPRSAGALPCPLLACSGDGDPLAPPAEVAAWRDLAGAGFAHLALPGGHFFLHEHRARLIEAILVGIEADESNPMDIVRNPRPRPIDIDYGGRYRYAVP